MKNVKLLGDAQQACEKVIRDDLPIAVVGKGRYFIISYETALAVIAIVGFSAFMLHHVLTKLGVS